MANILVVDDETDLREILAEHLADEGHRIAEACDGRQALELYPTFKPDLIISDVNMPVMDGYELLDALKKRHPDSDETPFLFLTALADSENQIRGLDVGVDEYLCKPVDFGVLSARVSLSLRRRRQVQERIQTAIERAALPSPAAVDQPEKKASSKAAQRSAPTKTNLMSSKRPKLSLMQQREILLRNGLENVHAASLVNRLGRKVDISRLALRKDVANAIYNDVTQSHPDIDFLLEINDGFFRAVDAFLLGKRHLGERAIVVPAFFRFIVNRGVRDDYVRAIDDLQTRYSIAIVSEVVHVPDRLTEHTAILGALAQRKSVQIIEIKDFQQLSDIDLDRLRVGAVSMDYGHAMGLRERDLKIWRQKLVQMDVNFYVKEIPHGKLGQAQALGADLLSVSF